MLYHVRAQLRLAARRRASRLRQRLACRVQLLRTRFRLAACPLHRRAPRLLLRRRTPRLQYKRVLEYLSRYGIR